MGRKFGMRRLFMSASRLAIWVLLTIVTDDHYKSINLFEKFSYQSILTRVRPNDWDAVCLTGKKMQPSVKAGEF